MSDEANIRGEKKYNHKSGIAESRFMHGKHNKFSRTILQLLCVQHFVVINVFCIQNQTELNIYKKILTVCCVKLLR